MLANPSFAFCIIWSLNVYLHSMALLDFYLKPDRESFLIISMLIVFSLLLSLISFYLSSNKDNYDHLRNKASIFFLKKVMRKLFFFYFIVSIMDIIYSKGLPIVWLIIGSELNYTDFGIPTLHGLANSALFTYVVIWSIIFCLDRSESLYLPIFLLFIYQLCIISRGSIIISLVEFFAIFLFFKKYNLKFFVGLIFFTLAFLMFFGYLGTIRVGVNPYLSYLSEDFIWLKEKWYSDVLWFYTYFTSGLNNLYANFDLEGGGYPYFSLLKLVPTIIYDYLGIEKEIDSFKLVVPFLNVSTFFSGYVSDFGVYGMVSGVILCILGALTYIKARKGYLFGILTLPIFFQAVIHSVFIDTLLYTVFTFQFFICMYISFQFKKRKKNIKAKFQDC